MRLAWTAVLVVVGCDTVDVPETVGGMCEGFASAFCVAYADCSDQSFGDCWNAYVATCCEDADTCDAPYTGGISDGELQTCWDDVTDCACGDSDAYAECIESCERLDD